MRENNRQRRWGWWALLAAWCASATAGAQGGASGVSGAGEAAGGSDRHRVGEYVISRPGVTVQAYREALRGYRWKLKDEYRPAVREKRPYLEDLRRPGQETTWQVNVPETYAPGEAHGVLVYINAGDHGQTHRFILSELGPRRLIAIGANHTGNRQDSVFRHAAAVDAVDLIRRRYDVDEDRIYVHGVSGGGRMASRVIFLHGHVFDGAIALIGCDPYLQIPAGRGRNTVYRGFWPQPDFKRLEHVIQNNRIVLVTGENDGNRHGTRRLFEAYERKQFAHLSYLEEPGLGHEYPSPEYLGQALDLLDAPLYDGAAQAYEKARAAAGRNQRGAARRLFGRAAKYGGDAEWVADARAKADELQADYDADLAALNALLTDPATPDADLTAGLSRFRKAWDRDGPVVDELRSQIAKRRAARR